MTFVKTYCNVRQEVWIDKEKENEEDEIVREQVQSTVKEKGYMYKGTLHLIKKDTNSWVLSHELTGFSIVTLNYTDFACAKKATKLIYSIIDWDSVDIGAIGEKMAEGENRKVLREIVSADENTLEEIRLEMLEKPISHATMIILMTA